MKFINVCIAIVLLTCFARPAGAQDNAAVVGVISSFYWGGGYADPIEIAAQVSTASKNILSTLIHMTLSNTDVIFSFKILEYDPDGKQYYETMHCDGDELSGIITQSGGELAISIDADQSWEVVSPANFAFQISISPIDQQQAVHLAVSPSDKFVKAWGVAVEAKRAFNNVAGKAARTAAASSWSCDVPNGFNYNRDVHSAIGYLTSMKIGSDTDLDGDLAVTIPYGVVVPVELAAFTAARAGKGITLAWHTETEQGNLGFNVERSGNENGPFERVNTALVPGAVQSSEPVNYSYTDNAVPAGEWYYRLQQVDLNGDVTYSPVIACDNGAANILMSGNMSGSIGTIPEFVRTLDGRMIRTEGAAPGMYLVRDGDSITRVFKLR